MARTFSRGMGMPIWHFFGKEWLPKILFLLLAAGTFLGAQAQGKPSLTSRPHNAVYMGFITDGAVISFNYERYFPVSERSFFAGKLGVGHGLEFVLSFFGRNPTPDSYFMVPHYCTFNVGRNKTFFEFGLGGTFFTGQAGKGYMLAPLAGLRIHPLKTNKVTFRLTGGYPILGNQEAGILYSPIGISVGSAF